MLVNPTTDDFKAYFFRDFPFGSDPAQNVVDQDIMNAFATTVVTINPGLFPDQATYTLGFELLAAHYMVMSLRASSQGITGRYTWLVSSKSVGSVSEGLTIPQRILDNPEFAMLSQTNYGAQFLFLILPFLSGNITTVCGATTP